MFGFVLAAFNVKVKEVLVGMVLIVPNRVPVSSYNKLPIANSVVNKVPVPVTVVEAVELVIVPVLTILAEFAIPVICPS